jgi:hypothetical protein
MSLLDRLPDAPIEPRREPRQLTRPDSSAINPTRGRPRKERPPCSVCSEHSVKNLKSRYCEGCSPGKGGYARQMKERPPCSDCGERPCTSLQSRRCEECAPARRRGLGISSNSPGECNQCGTPFQQAPSGRWYCGPCKSAECAQYQRTRPKKPKEPKVNTRKCRCGRPTTSTRHHYCDECRRLAAKRKRPDTRNRGTTNSRGYGKAHQRLRDEWKRKVDAGLVKCWRCGGLIIPGTPWDLGHDDADRTRYKGPEHRKCNRATNAAGRGRKATLARAYRRQSREW